MTTQALRSWALVHKWTSLVCTLFLLVLCVTGLPLLFGEEIEDWLHPSHYVVLPADTPHANLDSLVAKCRGLYPGEIVESVFVDDDEPLAIISMAPSWAAVRANPKAQHFIRLDVRTGAVLGQSGGTAAPRTVMDTIRDLHEKLLLGLVGNILLAVMGLLFVVAIVSGVVLYGPFMRKLEFGTVRGGRSRRLRWLDLHNLLGVVTIVWTLVVGATGVMNALSTPLFGFWQMTDVRQILAPWHGQPLPKERELAPVQAAWDTAKAHVPGMAVTSLIFPNDQIGSPHHYVVWMKGVTPLTARLFNPVLIDAKTGAFVEFVQMPLYLRALEVSRPLHFGDYGGLPLKLLWALLDLVTIAVLVTGIYLWLARRSWNEGLADMPVELPQAEAAE